MNDLSMKLFWKMKPPTQFEIGDIVVIETTLFVILKCLKKKRNIVSSVTGEPINQTNAKSFDVLKIERGKPSEYFTLVCEDKNIPYCVVDGVDF
jgi:hypothetical protein